MKKIIISVITLIVICILVVLLLIFTNHKKVGGGELTQNQTQTTAKLQNAQSSMDAIIAKDPSELTQDDLNAYVQAQIEQKQAQDEQAKADQEAQAQAQQQAKEALLAQAKANGYSGEGTQADYERLLSDPSKFGPNALRNADDKYNTASDKLDTFLQLYQQR